MRSEDQERFLQRWPLIIKDIYFVQDRRHLYRDKICIFMRDICDRKYDNEQLLK